MALIFADSRCPICEDKLTRPYIATSGCAFTPEHRLFRFCDAPLHIACLERWADREEFAQAYHDQALDHWRSGYGTLLHVDSQWFLGTGSSAHPNVPYFAQVRVRDWPLRLYTRFSNWDTFVSGAYVSGLEGTALVRAKAVMDEVRQLIPDQGALCMAWNAAHEREATART